MKAWLKKNNLLFLAIMIAIIVCTSVLPVFADEQRGEVRVFLHSLETKDPIAEAQIELYMIADYHEGKAVELKNGFEDSGITKEMLVDKSNNVADTLDEYIETHQVEPPFQTGISDTDGWVVFSNLPEGIFYVRHGKSLDDNRKIEIDSFVIAIPTMIGDTNVWKVESRPKCEETDFTEITVIKRWVDEGFASLRPNYIEIELCNNGELIDTVRITANDEWAYTWKGLPLSGTYSIKEKNVPKGYVSRIAESDQNVFLIENTYKPNMPPATGDETNIPLYIGAFCGAALALTVVLIVLVKRNKSKKAV